MKNNFGFISGDFENYLEYEVWKTYNVGTVKGLWNVDNDNYIILSFINSEAGNGHLEHVFEWFESFCIRDNKNLLIIRILNENFRTHLIKKRGFVPNGTANQLIKHFKK